MTSGRDRYLVERVQTASPEQLIKMLLDRAVAELGQAEVQLKAAKRLDAGPHLRRAQDIIGELRSSLDLGVGEIAANLDELYRFGYTELVEAGLDGAPHHVSDVAAILEPIRDAWTQACCGMAPAAG